MRWVAAWGASTSRPVVLEKVFGPQSSSPTPLTTVVIAGSLGAAGAGVGVMGGGLDLSLAPAADDGPPSPSPTSLIMGFLSLTAGTGTGTGGMLVVFDSKCVAHNQNRQL